MCLLMVNNSCYIYIYNVLIQCTLVVIYTIIPVLDDIHILVHDSPAGVVLRSVGSR